MTPDSERQAWREAVRAFRLAATALKDPAPALFADLSVEESLRDLMREPPLVYFSPFEALPDGVTGPDEQPHLPISGSGQALDPTTERGVAPADAGWSRTSGPPHSPRDLPGATPSQDDESAVRPPVFPLQRGGPEAQRQLSRRDQDTRGDSTEKVEGILRTGRFRLPGPAPEDPQRETPVAVEARLDLPGAVRLGAATGYRETGDYTLGEQGSSRPMALLGDLADEALEAVRHRTSDTNVWPTSMSPSQPVPTSERVVRSPKLFDLPEPDHEAYGNNAIEAVAPTVSGVADHPEKMTASDRSPFAFLDSVHEEPTDGFTFGPKPSGTDKEVPAVAADRYMDAETFALLVNDVLVEQARRHGVDLS